MSTTPPGDQPTPTTGPTTSAGPAWGNMPDMARLPIPGNAEFAVYLAALVVAMLVTWIADDLGSAFWLDFLKWSTAAYLLSRGIAKASRVLEQ
jgi:hypothetical protein